MNEVAINVQLSADSDGIHVRVLDPVVKAGYEALALLGFPKYGGILVCVYAASNDADVLAQRLQLPGFQRKAEMMIGYALAQALDSGELA